MGRDRDVKKFAARNNMSYQAAYRAVHGDASLVAYSRNQWAILEARYGYRASGTSDGPVDSVGTRTATFSDRDVPNRVGFLSWRTADDLRDPATIAASILWDRKAWPADLAALDLKLYEPHKKPTAGEVTWVGYGIWPPGPPNSGAQPSSYRKYVVLPCFRCGHDIWFDSEDPTFFPNSMAYAFGGGQMPNPPWLTDRFVPFCENAIDRAGPNHPCALVHSKALRQYEETGPRWTVWHNRSLFGRRAQEGSVLFFDAARGAYGLLCYVDPSPFENVGRLLSSLRWGEPARLYNALLEIYGPTQAKEFEEDRVGQTLKILSAKK